MKTSILLLALMLVGCAVDAPVSSEEAALSTETLTLFGLTGPEIRSTSLDAAEAMEDLAAFAPVASGTTRCVRDRDGTVGCCEIAPGGASACCCRTGPNPMCSCGPIVIAPNNPPSTP